jgi:hypothetical protein
MRAIKGKVLDTFDERVNVDESFLIVRSSETGALAVFDMYEGIIKLVDGESVEIVEMDEKQQEEAMGE